MIFDYGQKSPRRFSDYGRKSQYTRTVTLVRNITAQVRVDLEKKMVFIGGPRQVGKTTLATHLRPRKDTLYLNWDIDADRGRVIAGDVGATKLLVLDELHKYRRWRQYLKGLYDSMQVERIARREILVTGSARLDLYRYGGDSLQGRYHYLRLLPLSPSEVGDATAIDALLRYGGFPEQFLAQSDKATQRFSREYRARMVRDDVRDLERVTDLSSIELLATRLPDLVGAPLSINALREDLQVAHKTVAAWLDIIERLYGMFRLAPLSGPKIRAVKKERKHFMFDWATVREAPQRFENFIAVQLLETLLLP